MQSRSLHSRSVHVAAGITALSALIGLSGTLAGCTSGHTVLGTRASSCFRSLPAAVAAVRRQGHLLGVRRIPADKVVPPWRAARLPELRKVGTGPVCVVAFRGTFNRSAVDRGVGRESGPIAIVVLHPSDARVIVTLVLRSVPLRFRHL